MARRSKTAHRVKCSVCGLYRGAKPHTGPMHARIRAARRRLTGKR